jgi:hypothetical protein
MRLIMLGLLTLALLVVNPGKVAGGIYLYVAALVAEL